MEARSVVNRVATVALKEIVSTLDHLPHIHMWNFEPIVGMSGDTVNIPTKDLKGNTQIVLQRLETAVKIHDMTRAMLSEDVMLSHIRPQTTALAVAISKLIRFKSDSCHYCGAAHDMVMITRRSPLPLPGCGAIGQYAELSDFGLRVVLSYDAHDLGQTIMIDTLVGGGRIPRSGAY